MPKPRRPFSKKIKRRAKVRQAFYDEFVKDSESVKSVRFSHRNEQDTLIVIVSSTHKGQMPSEYEGYPVRFFVSK